MKLHPGKQGPYRHAVYLLKISRRGRTRAEEELKLCHWVYKRILFNVSLERFRCGQIFVLMICHWVVTAHDLIQELGSFEVNGVSKYVTVGYVYRHSHINFCMITCFKNISIKLVGLVDQLLVFPT